MEGESIKSNVESDARSATGQMYASKDGSEIPPSSHGDDALANLVDSMEQFVAEDSIANNNANDGATDQKHETRGSRRPQRTNATKEASDTKPLSETSDAIPAKRPQRNQASSQAPKKAKKDRKGIWSVENVLQNPKSPLVNANLKVCNAS